MLLTGLPQGGAAQDVPVVEPGSVTTHSVSLRVPPGSSGTATYRVVLADGLQQFGSSESTVTVPDAPSMVVPITFQVPPTFGAGVIRAASVEVRWPDGSWGRVGLDVRVGVRSELSLTFGEEVPTITPGGSTEIPFTVQNRGNQQTSVSLALESPSDWQLSSAGDAFLIPAGGGVSGTLVLKAPRSERTGNLKQVGIVARTEETETTQWTSLYVLQDESWGPTAEKLPTSLFVGAFATPDSQVTPQQIIASVEARGTVRDTDISLRASRYPDRAPPNSFRTLLPPPRAQLQVSRETWRATLGDVYYETEPMATYVRTGNGARFELDNDRVATDILVARPWSGVDRKDGHLVLAEAGFGQVTEGKTSFLLSDAAQAPYAGARLERSQSVGGRYSVGRRSDRYLQAEAGWMRVSDGSLSASGPTAGVEGILSNPSRHLSFRARYVPGSLPGNTATANEISVRASSRLVGPLSALGRGMYHHRPIIGRPFSPTTLLGSLGLALRPTRRSSLELSFQQRESRGQGALGLPEGERTMMANANVQFGRVWLTAGAQTGTASIAGTETPTHRLSGAFRYMSRSAALSMITWYESGGFRPPRLQSQIDAQVQYRSLAAAAGLIVAHTRGLGYDQPIGWASLSLQLTRDLAVVLGAEQNNSSGSRDETRFSVGIRKDFGLPLPIVRQPLIQGEVYEDINSNGVRDRGEPGIPDVRLMMGPTDVRTDDEGRFYIHGEAFRGHPLVIDVTSLEPGLTPRGGRLPSEGEVSIGLVRTITGDIALFIDTNGNGRRDTGEPAAGGTQLTLTDDAGRARVQVADPEGRVRLAAIPYGRYRGVAVIPEGSRRRETETRFVLEIEPGQRLFREIGLDDGARRILFDGDEPPDGSRRLGPPPTPVFEFTQPAAPTPTQPPTGQEDDGQGEDGPQDGDAPRQDGAPQQDQDDGQPDGLAARSPHLDAAVPSVAPTTLLPAVGAMPLPVRKATGPITPSTDSRPPASSTSPFEVFLNGTVAMAGAPLESLTGDVGETSILAPALAAAGRTVKAHTGSGDVQVAFTAPSPRIQLAGSVALARPHIAPTPPVPAMRLPGNVTGRPDQLRAVASADLRIDPTLATIPRVASRPIRITEVAESGPDSARSSWEARLAGASMPASMNRVRRSFAAAERVVPVVKLDPVPVITPPTTAGTPRRPIRSAPQVLEPAIRLRFAVEPVLALGAAAPMIPRVSPVVAAPVAPPSVSQGTGLPEPEEGLAVPYPVAITVPVSREAVAMRVPLTRPQHRSGVNVSGNEEGSFGRGRDEPRIAHTSTTDVSWTGRFRIRPEGTRATQAGPESINTYPYSRYITAYQVSHEEMPRPGKSESRHPRSYPTTPPRREARTYVGRQRGAATKRARLRRGPGWGQR
jgi:hypothetical protein